MRQTMRLEIAPDGSDVVQFRRILGQPLDGEPCARAAGAAKESAEAARCHAWNNRQSLGDYEHSDGEYARIGLLIGDAPVSTLDKNQPLYSLG
jgi:hypothetical protein